MLLVRGNLLIYFGASADARAPKTDTQLLLHQTDSMDFYKKYLIIIDLNKSGWRLSHLQSLCESFVSFFVAVRR